MRPHEQDVGPVGRVVRRSDLYGENRPAFVGRANRIQMNLGIGGGPGSERRANAVARFVERMEHAERVGRRARDHARNAGRRHSEAVLAKLRFRLRRHDNHSPQRPADRAHVRDLEAEAGERIETGPPGDWDFDDAKLCGGRYASEQRQR